jgi:hypothetical protein
LKFFNIYIHYSTFSFPGWNMWFINLIRCDLNIPIWIFWIIQLSWSFWFKKMHSYSNSTTFYS